MKDDQSSATCIWILLAISIIDLRLLLPGLAIDNQQLPLEVDDPEQGAVTIALVDPVDDAPSLTGLRGGCRVLHAR